MFALTYAQYGDPSVLEVTDTPEPHAGPGQVRIAVRASGVNPVDWKIRGGHLQGVFDLPLPTIVGLEAAGVVDEVGEGVDGVSVGDEVFGLGTATAAEFAVLNQFAAKPDALSWEQAGGLPVAAETALRALEIIKPSAGQTLLIEGAAGGVGSAAAQFARAAGVTVIGTASETNHEYLRSLGVVPTTYGPGLAERVAALSPNPVDVALDTAGKGSLKELVQITGSPDNVVTIADPAAAEQGVRFTRESAMFHALPKAGSLIDEGKFVVRIDSQFPLSEAAKAHERSEAGHLSGKIVLTVTEA